MMFAAHYRVLTTTSGLDALEILRREKVHILVSDQRMRSCWALIYCAKRRRLAEYLAPAAHRYSDMESDHRFDQRRRKSSATSTSPGKPTSCGQTIEEASAIAVGLESMSSASPETLASNGSRTILLIDHAPETATALSALLADEFSGEFQLVCARNLGEAIGLLETHEVAVVISEIHVGTEASRPS